MRFPIGPFSPPASPAKDRAATIRRLARIPASLRLAVADLSEGQLGTPYRPGGWSVRQLVHHVADSHLNFYLRLKLALTESNPTIRPYEEQLWAELADVATTPLATSLAILDGVHERADRVLRSLTAADFDPITAVAEALLADDLAMLRTIAARETDTPLSLRIPGPPPLVEYPDAVIALSLIHI